MKRSFWRVLFIALLLIGVSAFNVYITHKVFTSQFPGANDFYPRWRGAQLYWLKGIGPYSEEASLAIQEGVYGRPARSDEDQVLFAYPFYTVFFLLPLAWLDYAWAQAVWMVVIELALIGGVTLTLKYVGWQAGRWSLALAMLWTMVFYHSVRTIVLGQFAGLIFLWMICVLWSLRRQRDVMAGMFLVLTTIKPQMSFLFIPALLIWGVGRRRFRFVATFGVAMVLLASVSFALLPSWGGQFVRQVMAYPLYTRLGSPVWIVAHRFLPWLGTPFELGVSLLIVVYLVVQWRHLPQVTMGSGMFHWLVGLTLIVTNLATVRTATTNYVALYIPLFFALRVALVRSSKRSLWVIVFYLGSAVIMWVLFLGFYQGYEPLVMYIVLPFVLFGVFLSARRTLQAAVV
jgi:hypothetical protein